MPVELAPPLKSSREEAPAPKRSQRPAAPNGVWEEEQESLMLFPSSEFEMLGQSPASHGLDFAVLSCAKINSRGSVLDMGLGARS